jgi:hypothetical protein
MHSNITRKNIGTWPGTGRYRLGVGKHHYGNAVYLRDVIRHATMNTGGKS